MQQLQDIDEVNMFKDDHTVIHFRKPQSKLRKHAFFRIVNQQDRINVFFSYSLVLREGESFGRVWRPWDKEPQGNDAGYLEAGRTTTIPVP